MVSVILVLVIAPPPTPRPPTHPQGKKSLNREWLSAISCPVTFLPNLVDCLQLNEWPRLLFSDTPKLKLNFLLYAFPSCMFGLFDRKSQEFYKIVTCAMAVSSFSSCLNISRAFTKGIIAKL